MPRRIELTRSALADFDDIYDYIARDNPPAAAQVLRSLDESIQLLRSAKNGEAVSSSTAPLKAAHAR
jgi:plasmid stabilization system protein ParE